MPCGVARWIFEDLMAACRVLLVAFVALAPIHLVLPTQASGAALGRGRGSDPWILLQGDSYTPARSDQTFAAFNGSLWGTGMENYTVAYNVSNHLLETTDGVRWIDHGSQGWSPRGYSASAVVSIRGVTTWFLAGGGACLQMYNGPVCHTYAWVGDLWSSQDMKTFVSVPTQSGSERWGARGGHSLDALGGQLVLLGGLNNSYEFADVWTSEDGVSWALAVETAPFGGRSFHATAVMGGNLYLTGGSNFTAVFSDVWVTVGGDPARWRRLEPPPWRPRFAHALTFHPASNALVLTGGYLGAQEVACAEVWVAPAEGAGCIWHLVTANASWAPRSFHSTAVIPSSGMLLLTGGWTVRIVKGWPPFQYDYMRDSWGADSLVL